jgi:hypothetical protein
MAGRSGTASAAGGGLHLMSQTGEKRDAG